VVNTSQRWQAATSLECKSLSSVVHSVLQGRNLEPLKLDYRALAALPSAGSLQRVSGACRVLHHGLSLTCCLPIRLFLV
jgi:hypothetical protein